MTKITTMIVPEEKFEDVFARLKQDAKKVLGFGEKTMSEMTKNWDPENKPTWEIEGPYLDSGSIILEFFTTSTPFIFVLGTDGPYPITAKNSQYLHFKTMDGNWVKIHDVTHPGISKELHGPEFDRLLDEIEDFFVDMVWDYI